MQQLYQSCTKVLESNLLSWWCVALLSLVAIATAVPSYFSKLVRWAELLSPVHSLSLALSYDGAIEEQWPVSLQSFLKFFQGAEEGAQRKLFLPSGSSSSEILRVGVKRLRESLYVCVCVVCHDSCALLVVVAIWEGQACHTLLPGLQQVGSSFVIMSQGHGVVFQP